MVRTMPNGLARLESEGMLRRADGDLLGITPVRPEPGIALPSQLVSEGRAD